MVKGETAREIKSVDELVENGFLVVSEEYMMMVYDEEREGAGHAQRGEPGRPEDEEAFYRTRAEAKVQSLRARRLKRQLEELREQHQRRVEKLNEKLESNTKGSSRSSESNTKGGSRNSTRNATSGSRNSIRRTRTLSARYEAYRPQGAGGW